MALSTEASSTTSGSRAAFSITVSPRARQAAIHHILGPIDGG